MKVLQAEGSVYVKPLGPAEMSAGNVASELVKGSAGNMEWE